MRVKNKYTTYKNTNSLKLQHNDRKIIKPGKYIKMRVKNKNTY